ncbi:hypothetical protein [Mesoflavibacter sp. CH_XMU1404-2]|uniref:hypothetical protein n=1 Tax=Mesoflavibacter sp. CH_XMU1404-2 TaxID=3107766 RepID=UPI00243FEE9A
MKNLLSLLIGLIIGALISYYFFCSSGLTTPPPTTIPTGIITASEARNLNDNWTSYRKAANDSVAYGGEDNRSSWYSIDDMEYYINYAKDSLEANGIRLYLGVDTSFDDGGLTTIFMVPTKAGLRGNPPKDISTANALDRGTGGTPPGQGYPN